VNDCIIAFVAFVAVLVPLLAFLRLRERRVAFGRPWRIFSKVITDRKTLRDATVPTDEKAP
jgi:hypothetical protein